MISVSELCLLCITTQRLCQRKPLWLQVGRGANPITDESPPRQGRKPTHICV